MITRAYEFEIFEEEGFLVAIPYDLPGATEGKDFDDLCFMVSDWLKMNLEDFDMKGVDPPNPTYGNKPRHGGTNMLVCVTAGRETVPTMSATEAAEKLGISVSRVSQLVSNHRLDGWKDGRNVWVTIDSVEARLERKPHAGRPKKRKEQGSEENPQAEQTATA